MCKTFVMPKYEGLSGGLKLSLRLAAFSVASTSVLCVGHAQSVIDLPTSKQLLGPVPGDPRRVNSLPMTLAASPDGRYIVSLNAGYGTYESGYAQSLAVLDTATGKVKDFPDERVGPASQQSYFSGLAFNASGDEVYVSVASTSDPEGKKKDSTGNGVAVYSFANGALAPKRFLPLPMVKLGTGRHTDYKESGDGAQGVPYPAAIAIVSGGKLLVAENLSDSVALLDASTGRIERMFDLSSTDVVPSTYPIALAVSRDGRRGYVALWNASEVVELDLTGGVVGRRVELMKPHSPTAPGTHPCALLLDAKENVLYASLSNKDAVVAVSIRKGAFAVRDYFDTRLPGQSYFGAEPDGLAISADGKRLYVANLGSDAVAVLNTKKLRHTARPRGMAEPVGFIPTELMPTALVQTGGKLYVATGKAKGTGPNGDPQRRVDTPSGRKARGGVFTYAPTLLYGSLAAIDESGLAVGLNAATQIVLESNRMKAAAETIHFANGAASPIKHVIYIIKENRTYDQVFGDLSKDGKPVGNGDPRLTMYGATITPNQHKLALQFGVLDNFYDSAEVSADGHVWSNAGIGTDYLEATWQQNYSRHQRTYDYEGVVADGVPLVQRIPDIEEPASSYIWTDMAAHGRTTYNFGEYIASTFCDQKKVSNSLADPKLGAMSGGEVVCERPFIQPGEALPVEWGGGKNLWPWGYTTAGRQCGYKVRVGRSFCTGGTGFQSACPRPDTSTGDDATPCEMDYRSRRRKRYDAELR